MDDVARVVLALEQEDVVEEVLHFLDRTGRVRVVATASDDRQLAEAVRQLEPDAVVVGPGLVAPGAPDGGALLAVETRESVEGLRRAIRAGARGYFVWPADREELASAAAAARARTPVDARRGTVVAVYGPRGGVGTTFVATHLAAAVARRGVGCVLVDADLAFGDVGSALGATDADPPPGSIADLAPLLGELTPEHLDGVAWRHEAGFRVLLAPAVGDASRMGADELVEAIDVASLSAEVVVVHLPRSADAVVRACIGAVDRTIVVLTLDLLAFRAAKRVVAELLPRDPWYVVNRSVRAELTPGDVERVFGSPAIEVIARDRAVPRAQDHGRLLRGRGRTARAFDRLARRVIAGERA